MDTEKEIRHLKRMVLELTDTVRVLSNSTIKSLNLQETKEGTAVKKAIDKLDNVRLG